MCLVFGLARAKGSCRLQLAAPADSPAVERAHDARGALESCCVSSVVSVTVHLHASIKARAAGPAIGDTGRHSAHQVAQNVLSCFPVRGHRPQHEASEGIDCERDVWARAARQVHQAADQLCMQVIHGYPIEHREVTGN